MDGIAIYIHMPFCKQKCRYCDFISFAGMENRAAEYKNALITEINAFSRNQTVKSIFIGGGTPSVVDGNVIQDVMDAVGKKFYIDKNAEISIEANPGTITEEKLRLYLSCGINRISMGLQAWQDDILKKLGRIHTRSEFVKNYDMVRKVGFDNVNIDLMFALPNQSFDNWCETLENVSDLSPEHISAYSLIIEDGTPFFDDYEKGLINVADDELDRKMYKYAVDFLSRKGYHRYEISNFAKNGRECRHNKVYWQGGDYKGFGLAAASLVDGVRYKNTESFEDYVKGNFEDIESREVLTTNDKEAEFMFLGLRYTDGVSKSDFENRFSKNIYDVYGKQIKKFTDEKLLEDDGDKIRLTDRGIDISNMVFCEFL